MFENFWIVIIQEVGFLSIFGFFAYQLIFENKSSTKTIKSGLKDNMSSLKNQKSSNRIFFRKKSNLKVKERPERRSWFK